MKLSRRILNRIRPVRHFVLIVVKPDIRVWSLGYSAEPYWSISVLVLTNLVSQSEFKWHVRGLRQNSTALKWFHSSLKHNNTYETNGFHWIITLTAVAAFARSFGHWCTPGPLCVTPPCHPSITALPAQWQKKERNKKKCQIRERQEIGLHHRASIFEWNEKVYLLQLFSVFRGCTENKWN